MEFDLNKKQCYYFRQISDIPRGSANEKAISDYVASFAKEHGYNYIQDEVYNIIVYKPAAAGYEDSEPLILQAHMDMVCEKNKDVEHDFEKDPLDLYVEDGLLKARGTTLGADDGFGVAYMLALLDDKDLKAPALECCFTVMEEIGLCGAVRLKKEYFHSHRYINLDSGGETRTSVSSAGSARAVISKVLSFEANDQPAYTLQVRGLKGGHSGGCINLERGNSILLAARIMNECALEDLRLVDFNGGLKFNAIPREADLTFTSSLPYEQLIKKIEAVTSRIAEELRYSDEGFRAKLVTADKAAEALSPACSRQILDFLYVMPNGFRHRSMVIEGLTVASLSAGVIFIEDGKLIIDDLIRAAADSHIDQMIREMQICGKAFGFEVAISDRYSGWNYDKDSKLREILRQVLKEKGIEMEERATHGGLECSIFKGLISDLDIVTYGPIATGEHTPEETMDLASFDRAYDNLKEVLKRCK